MGYGRKGRVTRPSRIAVIPVGYADGLPRQLGNGAITFSTNDGVLVPYYWQYLYGYPYA